MRPKVEVFHLTEEEIIPTEPGERLLAFSYIPEIRLIEFLQKDKPELFQVILKLAFLGDREGASKLLEDNLGRELRDKIGDFSLPTREIISALSEQK